VLPRWWRHQSRSTSPGTYAKSLDKPSTQGLGRPNSTIAAEQPSRSVACHRGRPAPSGRRQSISSAEDATSSELPIWLPESAHHDAT
jgi:hypothetical protein